MPAGLQVWDASGNLILDTSSRLGKVLGYIDMPAAGGSGSASNAALGFGTPWWTNIPFYGASGYPNAYDQGGSSVRTIGVAGTTISWSGGGTSAADNRIIYGSF